MKGRKAIPDEIKKQRGTDQPSRMNSDSVTIEPATKLPSAPKWLTDQGKKIYHSLGKDLMQFKIINRLNIPGFAIMADALARYVDLAEEIKLKGLYQRSVNEIKVTINPIIKGEKRDEVLSVADYITDGLIEYMNISLGNESLHPRVRAQKDAEEIFRRWAGEFGLTPAAQSKILSNLTGSNQDPDDDDFDS